MAVTAGSSGGGVEMRGDRLGAWVRWRGGSQECPRGEEGGRRWRGNSDDDDDDEEEEEGGRCQRMLTCSCKHTAAHTRGRGLHAIARVFRIFQRTRP